MFKLAVLGCLLVLGASAVPQSRIVGGKLAAEGQFPWTASVRERYSLYNLCAGSIIGKYWILTSASCVVDKKPHHIQVTVGSNNLNKIVQKHEVVFIHTNGYERKNFINDIALLQLKTGVEFGANVKAIPLSAETIGAGVSVSFAGFGRITAGADKTKDLQYLDAWTVGQEQCQDAHSPQGTIIEKQHLCTLASIKHGACYEDGGAALVHNGKQVGIFSWMRPCANGYPDVFTRIPPHLDWIKEKTGITAQ